MRGFVVFLLALVVLSFSITKEDILKTSKEDVDKAIKLLKIYITEHPQENLERLGKIVFIKKKLSKDPYIGDAVIKEDFDALLAGLVKKGYVDENLYSDLNVVFDFKDELKDRIEDFDKDALKVCDMVGRFLKIRCDGLAKKIVAAYMEDPLKFDPKPFMNLACVDKEELKGDLAKALEEEFEKGEKNYVKIWTLSKMLEITFPHSKDLENYVSLSMDVDEALRSGVSSQTYLDLEKRYRSLKVEKDILAKKLENLRDNLIGSSKEKSTNFSPKKPVMIYIAVTVVSAVAFFIILVLMDSRHTVKRIKKKIERDPLNPDLHIKLAEIYERIGRLEDAMEEYKIASKLSESEKKND